MADACMKKKSFDNIMVLNTFHALRAYIEDLSFRGYDPYDGLNSLLFKALPILRDSGLFQLAWIQLFKKCPINLRRLLFVPREENPKGLALFLSGYCNLYHLDPSEHIGHRITSLANRLIEAQTIGYSGACWGYNFPWKSRSGYLPKYCPTIVVTSYATGALLDAYEVTGNCHFLEIADSAKRFILHDLPISHDQNGDICFSYSPMGRNQVFNATLLGSRMLARLYFHSKEQEVHDAARSSVAFSCKCQNEVGAWLYGTQSHQNWIDSFHTGFILECLGDYQRYTCDSAFSENIKLGLKYYLERFFTRSGLAKYFHNSVYPLDIHAVAQLVITLDKLNEFDRNRALVDRILDWTILHMQDKKGFFYYQKHRLYTNKIPYIRWSQAWMFLALSLYLLNVKDWK